MVAQSVRGLVPTLHLLHRGDIHIAHRPGVRWVPVARVFAAGVVGMDTGIQVPALFSGIANMNCLEVVGKVAVVEGTAESAALYLFAVGEASIGLRSVQKGVRMAVG